MRSVMRRAMTAVVLTAFLCLICLPGTAHAEGTDTQEDDSVAKVLMLDDTEKYYADLEEALEATVTNEGARCYLLKDASLDQDISLSPSSGLSFLRLYLNGYTISGEKELRPHIATLIYGPGMIEGNLKIPEGLFNSNTGSLVVNGNLTGDGVSKFTVESGKLEVYGTISNFAQGIQVRPDAELYCYGKLDATVDSNNQGTVLSGVWLDSLSANGTAAADFDQTGDSTTDLGTVTSGSLILNTSAASPFSGAIVSVSEGGTELVSGTVGTGLTVPLTTEGEHDLSLKVTRTSGNDNFERSYPLKVRYQKQSSQIQITGEMDKVYDKAAVSTPAVSVTGSQGAVTYTWYQKTADGGWTPLASAPVNAGEYKVRAEVAEDAAYGSAYAEKEFTIEKAEPTYILPADLTINQGAALSTVPLPEGFAWKDGTQTADALGKQVFKAVFTPSDTANYNTAEVEIEVTVMEETSEQGAGTPGGQDGAKMQGAGTSDGQKEVGEKTAVQTGDDAVIFPWCALLALSGIAFLAVVIKRQKDRA